MNIVAKDLTNAEVISELSTKLGEKLGTSNWLTITQEMINNFGRATLDPDPMHIDPEWSAKHSPFKSTIAYGFMTTSLLTYFMHDIIKHTAGGHAENGGYPINYGFDRLRLTRPIPVNSRIRAHLTLLEFFEKRPGELIQKFDVSIEIEGEPEPALIAEWLSMWIVGEQGHDRLVAKG